MTQWLGGINFSNRVFVSKEGILSTHMLMFRSESTLLVDRIAVVDLLCLTK